MYEALKMLENVIDERQQHKVLHKMSDIIGLVFFATLGNADDWVEIEMFGKFYEKELKKYLELANGIPSHDTIQRVFSMVSNEFIAKFQDKWNELLSEGEGKKVKRLLAIDGKTQRGNGNKNKKSNHIVSAVNENGFCISQKLVSNKSNEIVAIPELLKVLNIKGNIITIDAMGTQKNIAEQIKKQKADYVLALKGNQGTLYEDAKLYFSEPEILKECEYTKTIEKARGGIEKREYWQTDNIKWLPQKKEWKGLKSIIITKNTIIKDNKTTIEERYFISSLGLNIDEVSRAIRGHWIVESYHWHLDVTFKEDSNHTIDKVSSYNLNIIRKVCLNILKLLDLGKKYSLKKKRFAINCKPTIIFEQILQI